MTFLNPLLLFGLFAAAIPIVLHFFNLRKLKKVEFSTLSFLKELQKTKIRKIVLKQWLLLVIRVMIISLLVMAFARPAIKSVSLGSSAAKTTAVIIIDNTFSMSLVTDKGSYLNRAKLAAKKLLNNFQDGDEISVIGVGQLSNEIPPPISNKEQLIKKIEEIEISFASRTLHNAIEKAAQVLYQSKNFNKEIYLLTDLQKGRIYNTSSELSPIKKTSSGNVLFYLIALNEKKPLNLGIDELMPDNQIFEKSKKISFTASVKNYSDQPVNNNIVSLFINGKRNAQQSISLPAGESREVFFETTLQDTGLVEIASELEEDDILQDNKRFFSVYVPNKLSVLFLADNSADNKFIKLALGFPIDKIKITEKYLSQLSSLKLKEYDAVFLIGSENFPEGDNIKSYVKDGGGLILMPGSQSSLQNYQQVCRAFNISVPSTAVGKLNSTESIMQFSKVDFQNPLFRDLFEEKSNPQIESPEIYFYFKTTSGAGGRNIISLLDNSSFLSEYKVGRGKILAFASSLTLSWSNFPLKSLFSPLMNKILLHCASNVQNEQYNLTGTDITADIGGYTIPQIKVEKPNGAAEYFNADSLINKNYLTYKNTDEPGIFKFTSGGKLLDFISVNHDKRESVTEYVSEAEFEDYLSKIQRAEKFFSLSINDDFSKVIYQSRFGTELWKHFLILILILAVIESLVARSSKKEMSIV